VKCNNKCNKKLKEKHFQRLKGTQTHSNQMVPYRCNHPTVKLIGPPSTELWQF